MILRTILISFLLAATTFAEDMTQATPEVSPDLFRSRGLKIIPDLSWDETPVSVDYMSVGGQWIPVARFRGRVPSLSGNNLLYTIQGELRTAKVNEEDGSVEVFIPVNANEVTVRLRAIDNEGNTVDDGIVVTTTIEQESQPKNLNMDVGVGTSLLNYKEQAGSQLFKVSELGITVKAGVNYQLNSNWEIGGNSFVTAYPIALSMSPAELKPARWYGVNGRVGYRLGQLNPNTTLHVLGGWYVWGMITSPASRANTYGVSRLGGPQVFLTSRFKLNNGRAASAYLKLATIQDTTAIISAEKREIAIGGAFQISRPNVRRRRWMATLDLANAKYRNTSPTRAVDQQFQLNSFSIGIGTNF